MGFLDNFKGAQYKSELEALQKEYDDLKSLMTPEMQNALKLKEEIARLRKEAIEDLNRLSSLQNSINTRSKEISTLDSPCAE